MAEFPDHPFWDFSLEVYMSDGVGPACLELQDAHELDVNVLLFCMWVGASGRGALTVEQMETVAGAVHEWHEDIVRVLRALRTRMKGGMAHAPAELAESLRQRIQKTEIDCEHTEQLMLAGAVELPVEENRSPDARLSDAVSNTSAYFRTFAGDASARDRTNIALMLAVAFRDLSGVAVETACGNLS